MHEILGTTVKDSITDFEGVVIGRVEYITGCDQLLVQPRMKDGTLVESRWLDVQRCEVQDSMRVVLDNGSTPGFDKPAPTI